MKTKRDIARMSREAAHENQLRWERTCHRAITSDVLWHLDVYRAALYLLHLSLSDCAAVRIARPGSGAAEQLSDAVGSISANISDGYGRATRADRLRFFGYSLASTRECVTWYLTARDILSPQDVDLRLVLVARIRSMLLALIRSTRKRNPPEGGFER